MRDSWGYSYNGERRPSLTWFLGLCDDVRTGVTKFITEIRQMMWLVVFYNDTKKNFNLKNMITSNMRLVRRAGGSLHYFHFSLKNKTPLGSKYS